MTQGNFFVIDRGKWANVCELGMNPAVAYLVLARFSAKNNRDTRASTNAVETHTGISRGRAKKAIGKLVTSGVVKQQKGGTLPHYELVHPAKPAKLDPLWLPNALVDGASGEASPIERVRQTADPMCLRLFVDLYGEHNLREGGGVDRSITWGTYERKLVHESGSFSVWGFRFLSLWVREHELTKCHYAWVAAENGKQKRNAEAYFQRLGWLVDLGLVEWIAYLYESEGVDAEPIYPYGQGDSDSMEDRLGAAARAAAEAMVHDWKLEQEVPEDLLLVPLPRHFANVAMIGIARLRYRPHTKATSAWWADLNEKCPGYLRQYEALASGQTPSVRVTG